MDDPKSISGSTSRFRPSVSDPQSHRMERRKPTHSLSRVGVRLSLTTLLWLARAGTRTTLLSSSVRSSLPTSSSRRVLLRVSPRPTSLYVLLPASERARMNLINHVSPSPIHRSTGTSSSSRLRCTSTQKCRASLLWRYVSPRLSFAFPRIPPGLERLTMTFFPPIESQTHTRFLPAPQGQAGSVPWKPLGQASRFLWTNRHLARPQPPD